MKKFLQPASFSFIVLFVLSACADVKITHSWKSEEAIQNRFNKILIVGLFTSKDRALRAQMESHLQDDLRELGYNSESSIKLYGPKSFEGANEDALLSKVEGDGIDVVLTVVLLDRKKEKHYIPGRVYFSPYYSYHHRFSPYWGVMYERIYTPGYYQSSTKYFWESNIYNLKTKQLIYSVQTESFEPNETTALAHRYGKVIINDLKQKNVLR